ncbi:MAG: cytochrome c3 family protein [Polyangiales bacterium]
MIAALMLLGIACVCALVGWLAARELTRAERGLAAAMLAGLGVVSGLAFAPSAADAELQHSLPVVGAALGFASSDACRACHPGQYESWHDTFHRTMTQVAGPDTVLAPFDGRTLDERGRSARVLQEDGRYYVESTRSGQRWRVVMLTGSHHLQAYWLRLEDGRLSQFPFVYLMREQRWLANSDSFLQPEPKPEEEFEEYIWGDGCVNCHSTGGPFHPADVEPHVTTTRAVTELGIACEACHGGAEEHAQRNRDPRRRYALHAAGAAPDDTIVNPRRLDAEHAASVCGRCHTVADHLDDDPGFAPGAHLADSLDHPRLWALLDANDHVTDFSALSERDRDLVESFWNGGTVRVAGREYDGMIRSECYLQAELSCISCHSVHGGTRAGQVPHENDDAQMCGSCHERELADVPAHTHHAAGSVGSECVSCHMPYTSYGLLMATRSHRLDSPVASGFGARDAPNACNLCHQDQSLAWTARTLDAWYERSSPPIPEALADIPAGALWLLRGDAVQRALAAWHLRQRWVQESGDLRELEPHLVTLLNDPVSAVRQVGGRTLQVAHPEWGLDLPGIAQEAQPALAERLLGGRTGMTPRETFERLRGERIDLPVSVPE